MKRPITNMDRRGAISTSLGGVALLALPGCIAKGGGPFPDRPSNWPDRFGDAHVHLFNAADLPVRGFLENVVFPDYGWTPSPRTMAILDFFIVIIKNYAPTAREEMGGAAPPSSPSDYAILLKERAETFDRSKNTLPDMPGASGIAKGYEDLGDLIGRDEKAVPDTDIIDWRRVSRLVSEDNWQAARPEGLTAGQAGAWQEVVATLRWGYLLLQPRARMMERYRQFSDAGGSAVGDVVNLLVDYDGWLGDAPAPGSAMLDQLAYWASRARSPAPNSPVVHTFAGYDPLRHAAERRDRGDDATLFAALVREFEQGRCAGLKLYPPMGFRAIGNETITATTRGAKEAARSWGGTMASLATALDDALEVMFDTCAAKSIPLMAHAALTRAAFPGAERLAHPEHWIARIAASQGDPGTSGLRVCLAHLSLSEAGVPEAVEQLLVLNARKGGHLPRVWFDISFDDYFLGGGGPNPFTRIRDLCRADPGRYRWFLFGSDWNMVARSPDAAGYMAAVRSAMAEAGIPADAGERIMRTNLSDFLRGATP